MTLEKFLDMINKFQDFQLFDHLTGYPLSSVTYIDGSGEWELIQSYFDCEVTGISTERTSLKKDRETGEFRVEKEPFLKIMIEDKE